MNFAIKSALATFCLTGNLSIECYNNNNPQGDELSRSGYEVNIGFKKAYADESGDGDEDPGEAQRIRQRCQSRAAQYQQECFITGRLMLAGATALSAVDCAATPVTAVVCGAALAGGLAGLEYYCNTEYNSDAMQCG